MSKGKEPSAGVLQRARDAVERDGRDCGYVGGVFSSAQPSVHWIDFMAAIESALTAAREEAIEAAAKVAESAGTMPRKGTYIAMDIRALLPAQEQEAEGG